MAGAGWYPRRHRRRPVQILRDDPGLTGTKFGCPLAQCGAGTVLVDGRAAANPREGAEIDAAHLSRQVSSPRAGW
jgi:aerobic-type carbon monoxide dehydrogenase small subunit (CoxS/CutS family)